MGQIVARLRHDDPPAAQRGIRRQRVPMRPGEGCESEAVAGLRGDAGIQRRHRHAKALIQFEAGDQQQKFPFERREAEDRGAMNQRRRESDLFPDAVRSLPGSGSPWPAAWRDSSR